MIDQFDQNNLKELSAIGGKLHISLYIPTHEAGKEVNENMDILSYKNELQNIQQRLEKSAYKGKYIEELLAPAKELMDDTSFWKNQSQGLAVFVNDRVFEYFRLPFSFKNSSFITSGKFIIIPLIPVLKLQNKFFILSLNQYEFKLFECSFMNTIKRIEIENSLMQKIGKVLAPTHYPEPQAENQKKDILWKAKEEGISNISEFFGFVNEVVTTKLKKESGPLVLAGIEEWQSVYRKVNTYKNIWEKGFTHNVQFFSDDNLFNEVKEIIRPYYEKPLKEALKKYQRLEGTGKTSFDLKNILPDAHAGRIDTLFISEEKHIWGKFHPENNEVRIEPESSPDNYCLLNLASIDAMNNGAAIYLLKENNMPQSSDIAAIYRY